MGHIGLSLLGYNRHQVDRLFEQKDQTIKRLEKDMNQMATQVEQLLQKLAKFEAMEEELKAGILDARVTGKQIMEQSTQEAERLVAQTNEQATQYKEELAHHSRELINSGTSLKERMTEMKHEMLTTLQSYQKMLESTDFEQIYPKEQVTQLLEEVELLEADPLFETSDTPAKPVSESLSQEEKSTLSWLIQEVFEAEELPQAVGDHVDNMANLIPFDKNKKQA